MRTARIILEQGIRVGEVDPRLYESFVEHLGRGADTAAVMLGNWLHMLEQGLVAHGMMR